MGDLLKEAIADAKAVRETALQNAKMALEEAFTPQLKNMLTAKLREDDDDREDQFGDEEVPVEEPELNVGDEEGDGVEEIMPPSGPPIPISPHPGPVYRDEEDEEGIEGEEELDLEAIIKELESELNEEDDAYDEDVPPEKDGLAEEDDAYDEPASKEDKNDGKSSSTLAEQEDEEEDEETVEEQSDSSNIGTGDNKVNSADASDEEDPQGGTPVVGTKMESVVRELREYKEAVRFLKNKLHEVNILNAKLLFTNKLFKEYSLNNNQKLKVVETFDRAQTTREIKLVFSTLAEQFSDSSTINRKKSIKESASSKVGSTKPSKGSRKVITEEAQVANRFKKLAGLIK